MRVLRSYSCTTQVIRSIFSAVVVCIFLHWEGNVFGMFTVAIICYFSSFLSHVVLLLRVLPAMLSPIILFETVFYLINGPSLYLLGQKLAKKGRPRQNDSPVPAQTQTGMEESLIMGTMWLYFFRPFLVLFAMFFLFCKYIHIKCKSDQKGFFSSLVSKDRLVHQLMGPSDRTREHFEVSAQRS